MSDGARHHQVWRQNRIWVLPLTCLGYVVGDAFGNVCSPTMCLSYSLFVAAGVPLGYFMGRYIDPDLDQMGTTGAEGRMVNEIPVLGHFLYGHWSTYGSIFRRHHRSFWTHFPVVSTLIRMIYQFYPLFVILALRGWFREWQFMILLGMLIGLSYADFLHWIEDIRSGEMMTKKT